MEITARGTANATVVESAENKGIKLIDMCDLAKIAFLRATVNIENYIIY